jgi:tetrahydromethanopterin S-methyltransferase subunit C
MKRILVSAIVGVVIGVVLGAMLGHKLPPTRDQVVEFIGHQSLSELSGFNKRLMEQWGLQVYQPQVVPTGTTVPAVPSMPTELPAK